MIALFEQLHVPQILVRAGVGHGRPLLRRRFIIRSVDDHVHVGPSGSATVNLTMPGFTMDEGMPVLHHTLVVRTTAAKAGCGIVGTPEVALPVGSYPGYSGDLGVSGSVFVINSDDGIYAKRLSTVSSRARRRLHIHAGFSCLEAEEVGAHYFETTSDDPWSTTYTSDEYGRASVSLSMSGFSLADDLPVSGRTVVVHSSTGKVGCGLLEPTVGEVVSVGLSRIQRER